MVTTCKFVIYPDGKIVELMIIPQYVNNVGKCVAQFLPKGKIALGTWIPSFDIGDCVAAFNNVQKREKGKNGGLS